MLCKHDMAYVNHLEQTGMAKMFCIATMNEITFALPSTAGRLG